MCHHYPGSSNISHQPWPYWRPSYESLYVQGFRSSWSGTSFDRCFAGRSKPVTVIAVITVIQLAGGEQEEEEENLGFGDSVHVRDTAHWDHHDHGSIEGAISTDPSVPSTIVGA